MQDETRMEITLDAAKRAKSIEEGLKKLSDDRAASELDIFERRMKLSEIDDIIACQEQELKILNRMSKQLQQSAKERISKVTPLVFTEYNRPTGTPPPKMNNYMNSDVRETDKPTQ